ncbi:hypothetical protein JXL83_06190 [candidate division WOR-3 bacterium]|nr:hypothetical protein [candidate division WOR-3 bacterium]
MTFGLQGNIAVSSEVGERISTVLSALKIHCDRCELSREGHLYYIDPAEYLPETPESPRLGQKRGDDEGVSVQRLVYGIPYKVDGEEVIFEIESVYPVRTGRLGFGFLRRSGRTPTGFYVFGDYYLAQEKYTNLSSTHPGEITTGKILLVNVIKNGRSIYEETLGQNNPLLRGVIVHGFGLSEEEEAGEDEGSKGCIHVTAYGIIDMISTLKRNRGRTYIFIWGSSPGFDDLPDYEKRIFESLSR